MKDRWQDKSRMEKIAAAMYPGHLDAATREQMLKANPEQKAGLQRRMDQSDVMYGRPTKPASDYQKVPGLKRSK